MPVSLYPGMDMQGPVQKKSPMDALAEMLGVPPAANAGPNDAEYSATADPVAVMRAGAPDVQPVGNPMTMSSPSPSVQTPLRNQALSQAIATKYGVPSAGNGSISQQDLEALDSFVRGKDVADKSAEEAVAPTIQGQTARDVANTTGQYGLQEAGVKGQFGLAEAQAKAQAEEMAAGIKAGAPGKSTLGQQERGIVEMAGSATKLGLPILQEYEQRFPGISQDPQKYGHVTDMLTARFGKGFYSLGGMSDNDPLIQKSEAIKIWGARALMMGRVNKQIYDDILAHLPSGGYSPGANYDRLKRLLTDILPAQISGVEMAHPEIEPGSLQNQITTGVNAPAPQMPAGLR